MGKIFDLIEQFLEIIFFVPEQNPQRGVNTYRILRIILGILGFVSAIFVALLMIPEVREDIDFTGFLCIAIPFFVGAIFILRWFVVINRRYREARAIESRTPSKGLMFAFGLMSFMFLILSAFNLFASPQQGEVPETRIRDTSTQVNPTSTELARNTPEQSATSTATDDPDDSSSPEQDLHSVELENGIIFMPTGILTHEETDNRTPDNDLFMTIIGTLSNQTDSRECIYARDVKLEVDGKQYSTDTSGVMGDIQDIITPNLDYIGSFRGHCIEPSEQENTFITFDIESSTGEIALLIENNDTIQITGIIETATAEIVSQIETENAEATRRAGTQNALATQNVHATQTATLWTVTPTSTATLTPSITPTKPTNTPEPTNTPPPTLTPRPTRVPSTTTYYARGNANVRECAQINNTTCPTVGSVSWNREIEVIGTVTGDQYASSTRWYEIIYNGETAYIHNSFLSRTELPTAVPQVQTSNTGNNQSQPQNQSPANTPQQPAYSCNCSRTCGQMTCEEAYFQLNQCGCSRRDSDGDGVPCESICPGG